MKNVVKFYLSGFYKKPKGLKKPYNPTLGEIFRCYWDHPSTNSKTFYIAEQVRILTRNLNVIVIFKYLKGFTSSSCHCILRH